MVDGHGAGKGDDPRKVNKAEYDKNFTAIFGEWKSPKERRLEELRKDLDNCTTFLSNAKPNDPDIEKITKIVKLIEDEIKELD